jgi:phenylpropionate dioxygenase-like ring-hydroxylating dioxygenase large terminal subunit
MDRCPLPPYPNGWFRAAFSDEVPGGALKSVTCWGRDLVVFRGRDGVARVLDAYCAHLGAHLGEGGKVIGDAIRCPFHGWRYDGEGRCVEIPGAQKIPPRARVRGWPVREVNGVILVYHDAEGNPPDYDIPALPEFGSKDWTACAHFGCRMKTHIQETKENIVDLAHFTALHSGGFLEPPALAFWKEDGPRLTLEARTTTKFLGVSTGSTLRFDLYGLGYQVVHVDAAFQMKLLSVNTPVDPDHVDFRFLILMKKSKVPLITQHVIQRAIAARIMKETREDMRVWEHKRFHLQPVLSDADGPIMRLRKWMSQFYTAPP